MSKLSIKVGNRTVASVFVAIKEKNVEYVNLFIKEHGAAKILLETGGSGNNKKFPLHAACEGQAVEIVKVLIEAKADVNQTCDCSDRPRQKNAGYTPIQMAVAGCEDDKDLPACKAIIDMLIAAGADINKHASNTFRAEPTLIVAVDASNNDQPDLLRYLIEKGADPNDEDLEGYTLMDRLDASFSNHTAASDQPKSIEFLRTLSNSMNFLDTSRLGGASGARHDSDSKGKRRGGSKRGGSLRRKPADAAVELKDRERRDVLYCIHAADAAAAKVISSSKLVVRARPVLLEGEPYTFGEFASKIVLISEGDAGKTASHALEHCPNVEAIFSVGSVSGFLPKKQKLGDILVSEGVSVFDISSNQAKKAELDYAVNVKLIEWFREAALSFSASKVHIGPVCCGTETQVTSSKLAQTVLAAFPNAVGAASTARAHAIVSYRDWMPFAVVHGVADFGDAAKASGAETAAKNALAFLHTTLASPTPT